MKRDEGIPGRDTRKLPLLIALKKKKGKEKTFLVFLRIGVAFFFFKKKDRKSELSLPARRAAHPFSSKKAEKGRKRQGQTTG